MNKIVCILIAIFVGLAFASCSSVERQSAEDQRQAPWWFKDPEFSARIIHVRPASKEAVEKEDGSEAFPILGLAKACERAQHGDVLLLAEGTYEVRPTRFHSSDLEAGVLIEGKALSIVGTNRQKTIVKSGAEVVFHFNRAGRSMLRNLTIIAATHSVKMSGPAIGVRLRWSWLKVDSCVVRSDADEFDFQLGVSAEAGGELLLTNSKIEGFSRAALHLHPSDPKVIESQALALIEETEFTKNRCALLLEEDAQAIVSACKIHDNESGVVADGSSKVSLYSSSLYGQKYHGVAVSGFCEIEAANNVFYRNGAGGLALLGENSKAVIRNNVFMENGVSKDKGATKKAGVWLESAHFELYHNAFWKNASYNVAQAPEQSVKDLSFEAYRGNIVVDPKFTNAAKGDFRPKKGSPLINRGDHGVRKTRDRKIDIGVSTPIRFDPVWPFDVVSRADKWRKSATSK